MDGLLLDTERIARQAFFNASQELGLSINSHIFKQLIGRNSESSKKFLVDTFGADFPYARFIQKVGQFEKISIQKNGIPTKPGIWDLLDLLDRFKIPRAVGTSTKKKTAVERLRSTNLLDRFIEIVGGDEVSRGKPAPDLFLQAASRLKQKPEHCLVLEDSEPGIRAANSAGMIAIMIPDLVPASDEMADLAFKIVPSLGNLAEILEPVFINRVR